MKDSAQLGTIAFITTPEFRKTHTSDLDRFIRLHLYNLCRYFTVLTTGRTNQYIDDLIRRDQDDAERVDVAFGMGVTAIDDHDLKRWRETIDGSLRPQGSGIGGMIEITYQLVEGTLDAIIHLTDWGDVATKPDSMVLRREANVHKVPIASDIHTAKAFIAAWQGKLAQPGTPDLFRKRTPKATSPLDGLTDHDRVLAMIAHDAKKLELCCFAVEHMTKIFKDFDYILATGTTGEWLKNFANACGRGKHDVDKIRLCESGPKGGDVQIAAAVARGICRRVIFLQDPFTSHAHETDIHLFEQSVLLFERAALTAFDIELATNVESARAILGV